MMANFECLGPSTRCQCGVSGRVGNLNGACDLTGAARFKLSLLSRGGGLQLEVHFNTATSGGSTSNGPRPSLRLLKADSEATGGLPVEAPGPGAARPAAASGQYRDTAAAPASARVAPPAGPCMNSPAPRRAGTGSGGVLPVAACCGGCSIDAGEGLQLEWYTFMRARITGTAADSTTAGCRQQPGRLGCSDRVDRACICHTSPSRTRMCALARRSGGVTVPHSTGTLLFFQAVTVFRVQVAAVSQ